MGEGGAPGPRLQPTGRPARRLAGPPAPGLLHPEPESGRGARRRGRGEPHLVRRDPAAEERDVVALPGPAGVRVGAEPEDSREVSGGITPPRRCAATLPYKGGWRRGILRAEDSDCFVGATPCGRPLSGASTTRDTPATCSADTERGAATSRSRPPLLLSAMAPTQRLPGAAHT